MYCFSETIWANTQEDPLFLNKIIWTDKAKFPREGIFNRKNKHFWSGNNPHVVREMVFQEKITKYDFSFIKFIKS